MKKGKFESPKRGMRIRKKGEREETEITEN